MRAISIFFLGCVALAAQERSVDPTFLYRSISGVTEKAADISAAGAHYKPLFGAGDSQANALKGIARFGEISVDPGASTKSAGYPREEQIYFIAGGSGTLQYGDGKFPVRRNDFLYVPAGVGHALENTGGAPLTAVIMGFKLRPGMKSEISTKPQIANLADVKKQLVGGHPASTLYQLMIGDTHSTRDKIAAAQVVTSLFLMEIAPGGTNFPHHHDREEEIYLLLDGTGDMVAGGGMEGIEGRHPAKPGDAYFIRLNGTVGFYNTGTVKAHILAVRSLYPFPERKRE